MFGWHESAVCTATLYTHCRLRWQKASVSSQPVPTLIACSRHLSWRKASVSSQSVHALTACPRHLRWRKASMSSQPIHTLTACSSTSLCKLMHGHISVRSTRNIAFLTTGHTENAHFPRVCVCVPAGLPTPPELTLHSDPIDHAFDIANVWMRLGSTVASSALCCWWENGPISSITGLVKGLQTHSSPP